MKTLVRKLNAYAAALPQAKVYYRESWDCDYFELAGKCFGRIGEDNEGQMQLTVKGIPEENEVLREQYTSVVPGYYANKAHWNSINLASDDFSQEALQQMIEHSYQLVLKSFTKKRQKEIIGE